jgi:hypothetical protein
MAKTLAEVPTMNSLSTTGTTTEPAVPDISAEHHFGWADTAVTVAIVAAAGYYLYRKLWRRRGACGECGDGKGCCATGTPGGPPEQRVPVPEVPRRD